MTSTELIFFTHIEELKHASPPVPASKFWPEWFKKQSIKNNIGNKTVKSCPAVLDVLNYGYIIPLWSDYKVTRHSDHLEWKLPDGVVDNNNLFGANAHSQEQIESYPFPSNTFNGTFKLLNPWSIRTPPGYSCYICSPHYNKHPNITPLSGIIDTDIYHEAHINNWFDAPLGEEILLPYGMPIAQVIPFKREEFKAKVEVGDNRSISNKIKQFIALCTFKLPHYRDQLNQKRYK